MEQYLQCIDYTLWEIIENGNAPIVTKTVDDKETVIPPTSVEEKAQRRAGLKARSTFSEVLDQTFDRLQNLISQLEIHGVEDLLKKLEIVVLKKSDHQTEHTYHCVTNKLSEEVPTNFAFMAYSSISSNSEVSTDSNCLSSSFGKCLESVEARLLIYKKNESVYEEDIKLLKCEIYLKEVAITELRRKLELAQKQKGEIQLTLRSLLFETSEAKNSADKPKAVKENNGALIIEDLAFVSDSEEEDVPQAKIQKKIVKPSFAKIEFVKSKEQVKSPRKTTIKVAVLMRSGLVSLTTARPVNTAQPRTTVNSARPMINVRVNTVKDINVNAARPKVVVNTANPKEVLNAVKGNQVIHRKICRIMEGGIDSGALGDMMEKLHILMSLKKLMEDMFPLEVTPKEGKSQAEGLGYSAVPPPHPLIYNRPNKLDLSYSGLDEFKEPEFKGYGPENSKKESNVVCEKELDNSKENSDNKNVSEVEPKKVRKNNDAPIIEDWVSDDEEQDESMTKPEKKTVIPTAAKIEKPGKPQHDDKGFVDSGCSRHMTGNIAYLSDFKQFDGDTSYFDSPTENVDNGEPKTADDAQKQDEDGLNNENAEQERFLDDSSSKDVNAVGQQVNTASPDVNTGSLELNAVGPSVSTASPNEEDNTEEEPKVHLGTNKFTGSYYDNTSIENIIF
ncbi:hypothetical protein Tco_0562016, partial [Tanacetum coccineum]